MDILYPAFEKARMIRKGAELVTPPISKADSFALPQNSAFHYVSNTKIESGPGSDHPLFKKETRPIQIYNQLKLIDPVKDPREVTFSTLPLISSFLVRNRRFRKLIDLSRTPKDAKTLLVINYSLIHYSYKYMRSLFAEYNEWTDKLYTVASTANELANVSQRNQFIIVDVPHILPPLSQLNKASMTMSQELVQVFNEPSKRMLLELWKWLGEEKHDNIFDRIEVKNYRFINFIIQDGDLWTCVNMDRLHWWKQTTIDQYTADVKKKLVDSRVVKPYESVKYDNMQLQKYLLRMFMTIASRRSHATIDSDVALKKAMGGPVNTPVFEKAKPVLLKDKSTYNEDDDAITEGEGFNPEEDVVVKKNEDLADSVDSSTPSDSSVVKSSTELLREAANLTAQEDADSSKLVLNEEVNAIIDADLAELETINAKTVITEPTEASGVVLPLAPVDERTYEDRIRDRAAALAEAGMITAAEYRRYVTLSEKYKTLPNPIPGGKGKLVDAMVIADGELDMSNKHIVAPGATVIDQTMLYSSIEVSQKKYIKHTLHKHILQMITHVQNADVIIDNIEIEQNETVLGVRNDYLVRVIPLEGAPTTWRFPVPEIDLDGTLTANGVKYSLRGQRYDWPIRKTASNKVTLCSYYGKYQVVRGRKAVNDYGQWLINEVISIGFSPELDRITDVKTANVFKMDMKAPRSISSLAKQMREFTVNTKDNESFVFNLDLAKIDKTYDINVVKPWMDKGFTPIAVSNKKHIVYYQDESFYLIQGEKVVPLGELEEILGLDISTAPSEYCELKIGGKYVPIGVILAHDYGLTELVKRLKIQTRRVPVGTRSNLQPHELALVFSDETLIFSKNDRMACLLLGGFMEYRRVIRGFSITDFDSKGVYQNVLDSIGGGTRLLREIDNARRLFVDPITKDTLMKLKQPTQFMGILVYATELLMDDMHRDEYQMSEQRIRGYERIAGTIYSQMVRSMRAHNARPGKSRYPLEMKPYAIWQDIMQDQALVVVKDINPIANLKLREEVTFSGNGGRSKDTMTAPSRAFGESDKFIISEATKDSGEVGISTFMPPNPQLANTLGMALPADQKEPNMSSIFSTSVLASPGAEHDD